jgi:hypothetical protein
MVERRTTSNFRRAIPEDWRDISETEIGIVARSPLVLGSMVLQGLHPRGTVWDSGGDRPRVLLRGCEP